MISKKQIATEMDGLVSLKGLVEVYEEVAAGRMQKIRGAVLQSRQFLEGLLGVFAKVKAAYLNGSITFSARARNGKTVAVFVSANSGLYGDIVDRVFEEFSGYVKKTNPEIVVLGKLGVKMMSDRLPGRLFNYYDFLDDGVEAESFRMIMRYLIQFEKIMVFYGQFRTILNQQPVVTSVSGDAVAAEEEVVVDAAGKMVAKRYLFEPSIEELAKVFEGEILASVFEQTLHESQLSKFASRMLALDRSVENIEKRMDFMRLQSVRLRHKTMNRKQLGRISGLSLWSGRRPGVNYGQA
jgi:ATP synthase F1 gamma subunit